MSLAQNRRKGLIASPGGDRIKLGFEGPKEVPIHRQEIHEQILNSERAWQGVTCG